MLIWVHFQAEAKYGKKTLNFKISEGGKENFDLFSALNICKLT